MDKNIGFIGLGNVGSKIANNIINKGYKLYVYEMGRIRRWNWSYKVCI